MPERIQRKREKGWKMPEGAIYVGRPSKWGNPFQVNAPVSSVDRRWHYLKHALGTGAETFSSITPLDSQVVVDAYTWWIIEHPHLMCSLPDLRDHDLVCWCPLDQPCHADVLLELANQEDARG